MPSRLPVTYGQSVSSNRKGVVVWPSETEVFGKRLLRMETSSVEVELEEILMLTCGAGGK